MSSTDQQSGTKRQIPPKPTKLQVVNELVKSVEDGESRAEEEGYGSDDDFGLDGYTSPLNDAPSYSSYLTLVPEYEEEGNV